MLNHIYEIDIIPDSGGRVDMVPLDMLCSFLL
jgi:hypothetical protein